MAIKSSVILAVARVRLYDNGSNVLRSATSPKVELENGTVFVRNNANLAYIGVPSDGATLHRRNLVWCSAMIAE